MGEDQQKPGNRLHLQTSKRFLLQRSLIKKQLTCAYCLVCSRGGKVGAPTSSLATVVVPPAVGEGVGAGEGSGRMTTIDGRAAVVLGGATVVLGGATVVAGGATVVAGGATVVLVVVVVADLDDLVDLFEGALRYNCKCEKSQYIHHVDGKSKKVA